MNNPNIEMFFEGKWNVLKYVSKENSKLRNKMDVTNKQKWRQE